MYVKLRYEDCHSESDPDKSHALRDQSVYNIKERQSLDWILKHQNMSKKDVPIILRNTIPIFSPSNRSKFKWTVYKGIRMGDVKPLS